MEEQAAAAEFSEDNEQMEFLGDAILGFLVSEALVARYPSFAEGRLSKLKAYLVSAAHLHEAAAKLDLGDYLLLGRGEELSGGRGKLSLLANAMEALIAAIHLEAGIDQTREFVRQHVIADFHPDSTEAETLVTDFKSALQERAIALRLPLPRYVTVEERGPEHRKTFTVEVRVASVHARAEGDSKKQASQRAAEQALGHLNQAPESGPAS